MITETPNRLNELEGLRGLLSWWVVICHALLLAGYSQNLVGPGVRLLLHGDYAVHVFIILSGFVIQKRWCDRQERFVPFIIQRFFRLWPCYAVCLLSALIVRNYTENEFYPVLGDPELAALGYELWRSTLSNLGGHLGAHFLMLHSAVPASLLPGSAVAILDPAWSISLEWQFYLVAVPLFGALRRGGSVMWTLFGLVAGLGWMSRNEPWIGKEFPLNCFLPQSLLLFGVGMISYHLWRSWTGRGEQVAGPLYGFAALMLFFTLWVPIVIWAGVLACILAGRGGLNRLLNSKPLLVLGRLSYSTYLGHMLVLWPLQAIMFRFRPMVSGPEMLSGLIILGFPLIVLLSGALFRWVEAPTVAFGQRLKFD